ncbi:hypothetical protein [Chondromyces crocatus]|uniref:Lipoprotein n=1 Tax=Chondromyces crocatus TaxID=52 RepID=A0A0K1EGG9_CHOCO|nr:hypothetical protein [Chondromyces crocatus]AKT39944.1 uncharacterized protein CMC5_040970 [Chondromyces crocatus]
MRCFGLLLLLPLAMVGCGSTVTNGPAEPSETKKKPLQSIANDRSMCAQPCPGECEVTEAASPGAPHLNIRRVFRLVGSGEGKQRVLLCREADTNFDGFKDVVRRYNQAGAPLTEEVDSNHDGRVDKWITFAKGRLAEIQQDTNHDGNVDEWKSYSGGRVARIKRDTNGDGRPDVWEIYREGRLERMGVDLDGDERVDRWDHDATRQRVEEQPAEPASQPSAAETSEGDAE